MEKIMGKSTRDAYGETLIELGKSNPNIVVLDADLSKSTKTVKFSKTYPERFFNVGIQEANMVGVASGLAACGKIPFVSSFASFLICKGFDQMRMSIAFSEINVKLVSSHGGISIGEDGASQMSIEDIALTTSLPKFTVIVPADEISTKEIIRQTAEHNGAVYVRTGRPKAPVVYKDHNEIKIGKGVQLREGKDITIIANGLLVYEALHGADLLKKEGIDAGVIDMHTIKPLDKELILKNAKNTKGIVVAEEHQIWGGLGSAVATFLSKECPSKMEFVAVNDTYAESGTPDELLDEYGLRAINIIQASKKITNS